MQRMLVDHLPGGEFHSISNSQMVCETSSVPKTNVTPERDFSVIDRLLGQKPNASYIALESFRGGSRIFRRGGLTTARGNGVCPLPRKAEKLLPLLFVTKN